MAPYYYLQFRLFYDPRQCYINASNHKYLIHNFKSNER